MPRLFAVGSGSRWLSLAAAGLLLAAAPALPARAGMVITLQNVSAAAGSSGDTLEVDLTNTGTSAVDIGAFNFELTIPSGSGITFTGADTSTSLDTYIFAGNSFADAFDGGSIYSSSSSTATMLDAGDVGTATGTVGAGATVGLGLVLFDVAGSAPTGSVTVTLTTTQAGTSLTDPNGGNIPIDTFNNGAITITGGTVPEPSAVIPAMLGLLGAGWMVRGSRKARQ